MQSVLSQKFADFDIWLLDSGSTDGSVEYVRQLEDERIRVINTPKRLSMTENWDRIRELPLAKYATILGQDDVLDADFFSIMVGLIEKNSDSVLFTAPFRFIDENGQIIRHCKVMRGKYNTSELLEDMLALSIDITATGYVFSSEIYKKVGGIPLYPNLLYSDYALWINLSQPGDLIVSDKECFSFRLHSNTSQTTNGLIYLDALERFTDFLKQQSILHPDLGFVAQKKYAGYVTHYGQMIAHRVLGAKLENRNGERVSTVVKRLNACIKALGGYGNPGVRRNLSIGLAEIIDAFPPFRWLFLQWKMLKGKI
jgi:glycosyltransferase involved in cell wall biosynthesis